jgi:CTP:molybdopterin cytidylyltransferase MocA
MTRDAGCELNLVTTLRHMINANNRLERTLMETRCRSPDRTPRVHTDVMSSDAIAAGVVLAAGAGTRYGMPKVLAEKGDWLKRAVVALDGGGCDEVIVVLGAAGTEAVDVPAPARAVHALHWSDGLSASLRAGLGAADAAFAVVHLVDTPDVGADVVARVLGAARSGPSGLARAVYAGRPGHPVVIARRHWPELLAGLSGDAGAGPFLRARDDVIAVECGDLAVGADIDERPDVS